MSNVRTLYTNLSNLDMAFTKEETGSQAVTGYDLNELKNRWERPDLPARILLPMEEYNAVNAGIPEPMNAGSSGVGGEMVWNIVDLFLWKEVGQGRGLQDHLPNLIRYAGNYIEVIMDNRTPATNCRLQSVSPNLGTFEFPVGTESRYYGVEVQLSFIELINPGG